MIYRTILVCISMVFFQVLLSTATIAGDFDPVEHCKQQAEKSTFCKNENKYCSKPQITPILELCRLYRDLCYKAKERCDQ